MIRDLSRLQVGLKGKSTNGVNKTLYFSNEDDNKIHFRLNSEDIFVDTTDFTNGYLKLMQNLMDCKGMSYIPKHATGEQDDKVDM